MADYSKVLSDKLPSIVTKRASIPVYKISLEPFSYWNGSKTLTWWDSYNNVKHHRNTHFQDANLKNTLNALGALYILVFELIRIHYGFEEKSSNTSTFYKHLQPRQELFLLDQEEYWRDIAEGRSDFFGQRRN